ncbi:MAG: DUF3800 domain-containing protein [Phycisphaerae bacterium]|nr:DUF3800 domain-containing protein [Phycisphaerae bacterium]
MSANESISNRPTSAAERFRLYVDESGDHVLNKLDDPAHRYLCLLGCWFKTDSYLRFHEALTGFKHRHIPHNPDEPLILHREDIINRRGPYGRLRDSDAAQAFDQGLLDVVAQADFRIVGVVIDKLALKARYEVPSHPYHLALGFLLQRYCGYLNHLNRCGDVMAESRGGMEDKLLKSSYQFVYQRGVRSRHAEFFQKALTTRELKLKQKSANISGLQLADLLGHPVKQGILVEKELGVRGVGVFAARLLDVLKGKYNCHLYDGRVWGYGKVLFPST